MKKFVSLVAVLAVAVAVLLPTTVHATPIKARTIPLACNWTRVAISPVTYYWNGPGYINIHTTIKLWACYITGSGYNGDVYAQTVGATGDPSECNYAFSARPQGNNGNLNYPAGQASTVGCYDGNGDADDVVYADSPVDYVGSGNCNYLGEGWVSGFPSQTEGATGPWCP
jgi:hypothetical protein